MKKKSLATMVVTLALVAAVGVGATLAYLSSTTGTLTNTFTVGKGIDIKQDESDESTPDNPDDRTETGNEYKDIQPGEELKKDPTVTVNANSTECYVFMKLEGADELAAKNFTFGGFDGTTWIKVSGDADTLNGIYRYKETVKTSEADQKLPALFENVTYSANVTEVAATLPEVKITSCAVQAKNLTAEEALAAAVWSK